MTSESAVCSTGGQCGVRVIESTSAVSVRVLQALVAGRRRVLPPQLLRHTKERANKSVNSC